MVNGQGVVPDPQTQTIAGGQARLGLVKPPAVGIGHSRYPPQIIN